MAARLLNILPTLDHPEEDTPVEVVVLIISEARGLVTVGLSIRGRPSWRESRWWATASTQLEEWT